MGDSSAQRKVVSLRPAAFVSVPRWTDPSVERTGPISGSPERGLSMSFITLGYLAVAYIAFRVVIFHIDRTDLQATVRRKGIRNAKITWAPFAPGWFFDQGERHYRVRYIDKQGGEIIRFCKVGTLSGIHWRD